MYFYVASILSFYVFLYSWLIYLEIKKLGYFKKNKLKTKKFTLVNYKIIIIALALNWANCRNILRNILLGLSAVILQFMLINMSFRDCTPSYILYKNNSNYKNNKKFFFKLKTNTSFGIRSIPTRSASSSILNSMEMEKFNYYLTGLIEGAGDIIVNKARNNKKNRCDPCLVEINIEFKPLNLPLALLIQKSLGFASLRKKIGLNYYVLSVNNETEIQFLIDRINGKIRTQKILDQFNALLDCFNIKYNKNISKMPINSRSLNETPWLSGFLEENASFFVRNSKKNDKIIHCRFQLHFLSLNSRRKSLNQEKCLNDIANLLSSNISSSFKKFTIKYMIRTVNIASNTLLQQYLDDFPLYGYKHLDYLNWKTVFFQLKKNNLDIDRDNISKIKLNMNDKRKVFTWDHLKLFFI